MNADSPSRRLVLRGALTLGSGLYLALVLPGCESGPGASSPPAGAAPPSPVPRAAARKATHTGVQYQLMPKGEQKCSNCRHFIPEFATCTLVDGTISPAAWCIIWARLA